MKATECKVGRWYLWAGVNDELFFKFTSLSDKRIYYSESFTEGVYRIQPDWCTTIGLMREATSQEIETILKSQVMKADKELLELIEKDEDIQEVNRRFDIAFFTLAALMLIGLLTLFILSI